MGTAMFAALAVGAPLGTALYEKGGFGAVSLAAALALLVTLILIAPLRPPAPAHKSGPSLLSVAKRIWLPGPGAAAAPGEAVAAIVTDSLFACTARTADQLLSQYVPVWAYEFKDTNAPELFNLPTAFPYAAAHASELQFLFNPNAFFPNVDYQVPTDPFPLSPVEQGLSRDMIRYWTNFVAGLDPNQSGAGLKPVLAGLGGEPNGRFWPRYVSASDDVQALTTPLPHPDFHFGAEHQCSFWEQLGLESGL